MLFRSGHGIKYSLAQGNYFPKPIYVSYKVYRYRLKKGVPVECTADEIKEQEEKQKPEPKPDLEDRVGILEADSDEMKEALEMILSGVTE